MSMLGLKNPERTKKTSYIEYKKELREWSFKAARNILYVMTLSFLLGLKCCDRPEGFCKCAIDVVEERVGDKVKQADNVYRNLLKLIGIE